jgi:Ca-activated chloride channel family protein
MKTACWQHIKNYISLVKLRLIILAVVFNSPLFSMAQGSLSTSPEKTETRNGNKQYNDENYTEAEANYKKALDIKNNMPEATFNLGDALYKQKRYDDAGKQFQLSAQNNTEPATKANSWYNLGNSYLEQKKWEDAIKVYKNALKINPKDADSRYNLAYANAMLKKDKGSGKGQDKKDQKAKKDNKKDNKEQNEDKKNDKNQDQQKQQQQDNKQEDRNKQQQKSKLSKEETEKLLQALMNEEQKTTQKMQKKQMKAARIKIQKDW